MNHSTAHHKRPSKGQGHCSLCHRRRICPTARPGQDWAECSDCGEPVSVGSPPYALAIKRHL
jgi:hypothetical protein